MSRRECWGVFSKWQPGVHYAAQSKNEAGSWIAMNGGDEAVHLVEDRGERKALKDLLEAIQDPRGIVMVSSPDGGVPRSTVAIAMEAGRKALGQSWPVSTVETSRA